MHEYATANTLWRYCEESAKYIFFHRESNPHGRKILKALKDGSKSTTDLYKIFNRKIKKYDMDKVLRKLMVNGRIEPFQEKTGGKPKTLFRMVE
jgi:pentose-5-phosphate-3-epimerase